MRSFDNIAYLFLQIDIKTPITPYMFPLKNVLEVNSSPDTVNYNSFKKWNCQFRNAHLFSFVESWFTNIVLGQFYESVSDSEHRAPYTRCLFIWKQMMHLSLLKAFGWNNKRNPWTGFPIQMEMNPPRCLWCAQQWGLRIRRDYEGCLPYHPVFTTREGLIQYAVSGDAWKLTEQIDDRAFHSWVSIYPEIIDKYSPLKGNKSSSNKYKPW